MFPLPPCRLHCGSGTALLSFTEGSYINILSVFIRWLHFRVVDLRLVSYSRPVNVKLADPSNV
jgi:hypothetical protein